MSGFCFFGAYDPGYPRNALLRKGLRALGREVRECRVRGRKAWLRYPALILRSRAAFGRGIDWLFVPEFRQKDMPLAKLIGRLAGKPVIFDPLAARYETKILDWRRRPPGSAAARWNRRIDRAAFRGAALVLADTAAHADYYVSEYGLDPAKAAVLPVGYDDELFDPDRGAEPNGAGPFTVLFHGSFLPLHGVESIIEAARIVAAADPEVRFVFCGSGQTWPRAQAIAAEYGLENCSFRGWRPLEEIPGDIAAASICLGLFGRTEKARRVVPHKIYQAMGMGKAVVTARTPAVEEFFTDGVNVRLCDEPYAESLAEAVLALKRDEALRARLAAAGYALVRERFTAKATAARLLEILHEKFGKDA